MNVAPTPSAPESAATPPSQALGREQFLNLLVAQLRHQDPLSPMEGTEFVTQLAQFSGVEQLITINQRLGLIEVGQASAMNTQAAAFVGREVTARGDSLGVTDKPPTVTFELDGAATSATITLTDESGRTYTYEYQRSLAAGTQGILWGGEDLAPGRYRVSIDAKNAAGGSIGAHPVMLGVVSEVSFESGSPELVIDGVRVRLGDVLAIGTTKGAGA
jgi:flagellar basal-body rod modification protein FlgD